MAADLVASWRAEGLPAGVKSSPGLRQQADSLVARAGASPEHAGWTMVTIVSEFWRDRLATAANGRRLLLLPDCPVALRAGSSPEPPVPHVCGASCGIATIWAAARDSGWVVESTRQAVGAIGSLLTGQYDGVLGVARLSDLEKAFAMLPAFALPVAAVPCESAPDIARSTHPASCAEGLAAAAIDVDWVLGLLGVAGGSGAPVGDYLPLLREAAESFTPGGLQTLAGRLGIDVAFGLEVPSVVQFAPLEATAAVAGEFVSRGGKFLRPFISLAAFDAVRADLRDVPVAHEVGYAVDDAIVRDAVKAAAVAIEVFHKASLVHDDIEDADRVRYGRPTVHEEHGVASAINIGDYLLGVGYRIVAGLPGIDPATARDLTRILASAHVRLARGQGAELWWRDAADKRLAPAESLEMYALKTSPAFEAAVALGIRLAGVAPADVVDVARYARHVGTGFQVLNDLKDWAGDLENNRQAAGDLLGGRPTLMWALAHDSLSPAGISSLREAAAKAATSGATDRTISGCVAEVRGLYEQARVFTRAAEIVTTERAAAAKALASCRLPRLREVLEFLLDLAVPEGAASQFCDQPS
ncbi:MAG: polyprenyl synthetase family protein [Pirellulales bacterium]